MCDGPLGRGSLHCFEPRDSDRRRCTHLVQIDACPSLRLRPPPPPSCTNWTRLVLLPVLTGHVSSFSPY